MDFSSNKFRFEKVKNKKLKDAIKKADNLILGIDEKLTDITESNISKESENEINKNNSNKIQINIEIEEFKENNINEKNLLLKKKKKREINKDDIKIIFNNIQKYFLFIYELINNNEKEKIKKEEKCLEKIFQLLLNYKHDNLEFLFNESNICKMIIFFKYNLNIFSIKLSEKIKEINEKFQYYFNEYYIDNE